nr:MAG TPA: Flagellar and Swarming motility protein [Bacteriophage sp.]
MGKKITLTHFDNKPIELDVDDIELIDDIEGRAFVDTKDRCCHFVKESKSRILKMIETAK